MLAVRCVSQSATDPLSGLRIAEVPPPEPPDGWVRVNLRTCALNHHDLWSLKGVGLDPSRLPMTLGCDGAGVLDDGTEVVIHSVIGDPEAGQGDETLDPRRTLLSELHQGTLAEQVIVPLRNLVPKPQALTWEEAACMPSAWLTAYRMLTTRSGLDGPGNVLVQGAGGGVATAAIQLGVALGHRVFCTSRDPQKRARSLGLGAELALASGERFPEKMDLVIETVGDATWEHSLRSLRPGGRVVVSGATSGANPPADLNRVFFLQLSVVGSTMGTREELLQLLEFMESSDVRPVIDEVRPLAEARQAFERLQAGGGFGKQVFTV
ncbi:Zn-dependent oxidoreductase, NADPH:quinone reductase [Actinobacteria bacterium IMCC26207]|nr:Zn-dependent oxidoreductase, NADPH:quinone reductase [Actinobacteria bacterium IMCC26207]